MDLITLVSCEEYTLISTRYAVFLIMLVQLAYRHYYCILYTAQIFCEFSLSEGGL